jgi:hypothetical protein
MFFLPTDPRLFFLDEAFTNGNDLEPTRGYAKRGQRANFASFNVKGKRVVWICAISRDQRPKVLIYDGIPCNGFAMTMFAEKILMPWCSALGSGPRSILIQDNAPWHSTEYLQVFRRKGVALIKSPEYNPLYQPTELVFNTARSFMLEEGEEMRRQGRTTKQIVAYGVSQVTSRHVNSFIDHVFDVMRNEMSI